MHEHVSSHHSFMYLWIVGALLVLGGLIYSYIGTHPGGVIDGQHEGDVRITVAAFGNQLRFVSLLSPQAAEEIRHAYGPYVTAELLARWMQDPRLAPGRTVASPWPDHIEVDHVTINAEGSYDVRGRVMLVTSAGDAGIIPVALTVANMNGSYLITHYQEHPGEPKSEETNTVTLGLAETGVLHDVRITPRAVVEDSRCPSDVQCIQAGTVRVETELVDGMGTSTMTFVLGAEEPISTEAATLRLVAVEPEKTTSSEGETVQYRFTFQVLPR